VSRIPPTAMLAWFRAPAWPRRRFLVEIVGPTISTTYGNCYGVTVRHIFGDSPHVALDRHLNPTKNRRKYERGITGSALTGITPQAREWLRSEWWKVAASPDGARGSE